MMVKKKSLNVDLDVRPKLKEDWFIFVKQQLVAQETTTSNFSDCMILVVYDFNLHSLQITWIYI